LADNPTIAAINDMFNSRSGFFRKLGVVVFLIIFFPALILFMLSPKIGNFFRDCVNMNEGWGKLILALSGAMITLACIGLSFIGALPAALSTVFISVGVGGIGAFILVLIVTSNNPVKVFVKEVFFDGSFSWTAKMWRTNHGVRAFFTAIFESFIVLLKGVVCLLFSPILLVLAFAALLIPDKVTHALRNTLGSFFRNIFTNWKFWGIETVKQKMAVVALTVFMLALAAFFMTCPYVPVLTAWMGGIGTIMQFVWFTIGGTIFSMSLLIPKMIVGRSEDPDMKRSYMKLSFWFSFIWGGFLGSTFLRGIPMLVGALLTASGFGAMILPLITFFIGVMLWLITGPSTFFSLNNIMVAKIGQDSYDKQKIAEKGEYNTKRFKIKLQGIAVAFFIIFGVFGISSVFLSGLFAPIFMIICAAGIGIAALFMAISYLYSAVKRGGWQQWRQSLIKIALIIGVFGLAISLFLGVFVFGAFLAVAVWVFAAILGVGVIGYVISSVYSAIKEKNWQGWTKSLMSIAVLGTGMIFALGFFFVGAISGWVFIGLIVSACVFGLGLIGYIIFAVLESKGVWKIKKDKDNITDASAGYKTVIHIC
jgi:hypothetical protein